MKRHLFAIAVGFSLIFVSACIILLYRFATNNIAQVKQEEPAFKQEQISRNKGGGGWIKDLADLPERKYILATNEIFMEFKNEIKKQNKVVNQLLVDKNDIYSMFCLSQTLDKFSVGFSVIKQNSQNLIYIDTQDKSILRHIANELKIYDIHSTFKEIKL